MVSSPDSAPILYSLWWFNLDRFPNCSKWFECCDVVSGLVSVMLKAFCSSVLLQIGVSSRKAISRVPQRQGGKLEEWLLTVSLWFIWVKQSTLPVEKEWRSVGCLSRDLHLPFPHFCSRDL